MASLSHSLCDYPSRSSYQEASSASMYPSTSSNYMQDLCAIMQTLNPQIQPAPYHMNALLKPFYYSSNLQGMSKVGAEEDPGSLSSSWGATDQAAASLPHRPPSESAMDQSKALHNSSSNLHLAAELHVNAAKKRVRAIMDHKDVDAKCAETTINSMKRLKSSVCNNSNGETNDQKKELSVEVKPSTTKAQKGGFTSKKPDHADQKSTSEVKPNGKASTSPTYEPSSPSKPDFIHVRARRGQATDSHSLAERVRRERISERMKYLQDLVPGCVKVTGKAMMLDEIINYVQALQRQVEFLSMKLAAVHPSKLEFSLESLFGKKVVEHQSFNGRSCLGDDAAPLTDCRGDAGGAYSSMRASETFCNSMRPNDVDASSFQAANQLPPCNSVELPANQLPCNSIELLANLRSNLGVDNDTFIRDGLAAVSSGCGLTPSMADAMLEPTYQTCMSQNSHSELDWDDDLQNIVQQMGCFTQASSLCPPHSLSEGFLQATMKAEL